MSLPKRLRASCGNALGALRPPLGTLGPLGAALNLPRTRLFKLLGLMAALLATTLGTLGAGAGALQHLYASWQLERSSAILVYLPPATPPAQLEALHSTLPTLAGVAAVRVVPPTEVASWVAPLLPAATSPTLPLPVVAEVTVQGEAPRAGVLHALQESFPLAELDDQAALTAQVGQGVRTLQLAALAVSTVILVILALMVALLVRAGLLAQAAVVTLLIQLGATDRALAATLTWQASRPVLGGTLTGLGLAILIFVLAHLHPAVAAHSGGLAWGLLLGLPLGLPVLAGLSALAISLHLLHGQRLSHQLARRLRQGAARS